MQILSVIDSRFRKIELTIISSNYEVNDLYCTKLIYGSKFELLAFIFEFHIIALKLEEKNSLPL